MRIITKILKPFGHLRRLSIRNRPRLSWRTIRRIPRTVWHFLRRINAVTLPYVLAIGGAALVGKGVLDASPVQVISGAAGVLLSIIVIWRIELGVTLLAATAASIVYPPAIPKPLTVGGQGLCVTELLVTLLVVTCFVRACVERRFDFLKSPMTVPVLVFSASAVLSIIVSYMYHLENPHGQWPFKAVYGGVRPIYHYLLFFAVAFGMTTRRQLNLVLRVLIWVASIVGVMMVLQYFIGSRFSLFLGGGHYLSYTRTLSPQDESVTRSLPPGMALMLLFFIVALAQAAQRGIRTGWPQLTGALLIGMGIVFTFTRNYWVLTFLSVSIIAVLAQSAVRRRVIVITPIALAMAILGSITLAHLAPGKTGANFTKALYTRFTSTFQRGLKNPDLEDRRYENRHVMIRMRENPFFGVGVGYPIIYKVHSLPNGSAMFYPVYDVHNSYLMLWAVYGLPGLLSFLWLSVTFLTRSYLLFRRARDPDVRMLALSFFAFYLAFLIRAAITMAVCREVFNITTTALVWGAVELLWLLETRGTDERELPEAAAEAVKRDVFLRTDVPTVRA